MIDKKQIPNESDISTLFNKIPISRRNKHYRIKDKKLDPRKVSARPDTDVEIIDKSGNDVYLTFIQMPNGHGKTTTHRLIQFALEAETQDELPYVIDSKGNEINPNKWVNGLRAKRKNKLDRKVYSHL